MPDIYDKLRRLERGELEEPTENKSAPLGTGTLRSPEPPRPNPRGTGTLRSPEPPRPNPLDKTIVSGQQATLSREPKITIPSRPAARGTAELSPQDYLERVRDKMDALAEEFAGGDINRSQFQELFAHYQQERQMIQTWISTRDTDDGWQARTNQGHSLLIRDQNSAKVLGYAIFGSESGTPIATIGQFDIDPDLAVPMLSAYRTATKEIFGAELQSTQIEGGKWLAFIPGGSTTLLAIFSTEPAEQQMEHLEATHGLFERANRELLQDPRLDPSRLVLPHEALLGRMR